MYLYISLKKNFFFCTSFKRICTPADDSIVRMFQKKPHQEKNCTLILIFIQDFGNLLTSQEDPNFDFDTLGRHRLYDLSQPRFLQAQ